MSTRTRMVPPLPALLLMAACAGPPTAPRPRAEPVLHLPFDEADGHHVLSVDGRARGEIKGAKRVPGVSGGALRFDGRSYALLPHQSSMDDFAAGITVTLWVRRHSNQDGFRILWGREIAGTIHEYFAPCFRDNRHCLIVTADGHAPRPVIIEGCAAKLEQWVHVAATFDNRKARLYVNGALQASQAAVGPLRFVDENPLIIASNSNARGADDYLNDPVDASLDDVRVYNQALSASEIAALAGPQVRDAEACSHSSAP